MAGPYSGHGTEVRIGATGNLNSSTGGGYTALGFVGDIEGPEESLDFSDVTHHGSSAVERIPNLNDSGTVSFELRYNSTETLHRSTTGILADLQNRTNRDLRIVMPSSVTGETVADMQGWFSSISNSFPAGEGHIARDVEYQITGLVQWSTST